MSAIWGNFTSGVARLSTAQSPGRLPEHLEPLKALSEVLEDLPDKPDSGFQTSSRAQLLRYLFNTVFCRAEWIPYLLPDEEPVPLPRDPDAWAWHDEFGSEVYYSLSGTQRRIDRQRVAQGKRPARDVKRGGICGKTLKRFDRTYTCKTCAADASCLLCVDCFQASEHEGHEVLFGQSYSFASSCDCGDRTAWKEGHPLGCAHHPPLPPDQPPPDRPKDFLTDQPDIPPALINSLYQAICFALDFIVTTLQFAPLPSEFSNLPAGEQDMRDPEYTTGLPRADRGKGPWSVAIWGDDRHTIKEITRQIRDACGTTWETAEVWARELEEEGRKVLITTSEPKTAFHIASMFQQIDLAVCLRPAYDVFREDMAGALIAWLTDMSQVTIGADGDLASRLIWRAMKESRKHEGMTEGTGVPMDLYELAPAKAPRIDWLLLQDPRLWKRAKWDLRLLYSRLYCVDWDVRKDLAVRLASNYVRLFEHFLLQDREVDTGVLFGVSYMVFGNGEACAHACKRAGLFETVFNTAQAWFTGQIRGGRLIIPPHDIDRSSLAPERRLVPESLPAFRGKKGVTIFGHIRSLLRHDEMQRLIGANSNMFNRAAQFLNIFVGMQTQRKETLEHIEFEVDWPRTFTYLGDIAKCARELGEALKYCSKPNDLLINLSNATLRVYNDIQLHSNILDFNRYVRPEDFATVNILGPGTKTSLICTDMLELESFSFHHYMSLLAAECFKSLPLLEWVADGYSAPLVLVGDARTGGRVYTPTEIMDDIILAAVAKTDKGVDKLSIMEHALQKHVILSHIRAELWRKNGAGMRGQAHHYRDVQHRDATLDQEFFLLQVSLCTMPPLTFFSAIVDRFALRLHFSTDVNEPLTWEHATVEPRQYVQIMEDFLMLCIHLVTDVSSINGWTQDQHTRKHIIQILGLGPLMFSELVKKLPERSTEGSLMPFLAELAVFKEPTETASGSYALKAEFIEQIDPFWHHYSRNEQRRAADRILEQRKKLKNDDTLIKPLPLQRADPRGPWYNIHEWLGNRVVHEIVHYTIAHCGPIGNPAAFPGLEFVRTDESMPSFDLLLDLALQLAMLSLAYDSTTFSTCCVQPHPISGALSTFQQLWLMQTTEAFKPWKPKVDFIVGIIIQNVPPSFMAEYHEQEKKRKEEEAAVPKPDARIAAAERQKQIMADFAKKQANFAAALLDEDDMDEDEVEAAPEESYGSCIVCQEDVTPANTGGMLALFQPSRIMRDCVSDRDWFEESVLAPANLDQATRYHRFGMETSGEPTSTDGYPAQQHKFGAVISACTHLMHESCMTNYYDATRYRHTQQVQRHHPENAARYEYLCPLCKSLGNMLVPLDSTIAKLKPPISARPSTLSDKIREVSSEGLLKIRESAKIWDHHVETGELVPWFSDCAFHIVTLDPLFRREIKTTAKIIERFRNLVRPLSEQSQRLRNRKTHMYVPDDIVGYTVSTTEISLRGLATPGQTVVDQVPDTSMKLIKKLIGLMQLELDLYFGPRWDRTALRVGLFARFLPDWYRASTLPSPLLLRNPIVLVIETAAIAPDLLQAVIHMAYYAELTRTMLGMNMWIKRCCAGRTPPAPRTSPPADPALAQALSMFRGFKGIMRHLLRNAGPFTDADNVLSLVSDDTLAKVVYSHTLPFLRRCAIVFQAVADQLPRPNATIASGACEYAKLLQLLGIPEPIPTLSSAQSTETPIVIRWLNQWAMQGRIIPQLEYPGTYELTRLPRKWEDVMIRYAEKLCEVCGTRPTYPAICLFCGALVCLAGDCCAEGEQGECNIHMRSCGAVVGLYVDIRRWLIVYLYAGSGSFGHMPYLDAHGELDISMRRGHRQFMHLGRMDDLRRTTWLQHMIPHLTARKLELTSDGGGWGSL